MAKNLIPEICKMLGVELGEEFKVKGDDETTYSFTDDGLKLIYNGGIGIAEISSDAAFIALLKGKDEIVKLPWRPKEGEKYWGFLYSNYYDEWLLCLYTWGNKPEDFAFYKAGWVFHTKKEAKAALPTVAKEMGVEYEL